MAVAVPLFMAGVVTVVVTVVAAVAAAATVGSGSGMCHGSECGA